MLIPSKQAKLIRSAEGVLFINPEGTKKDRIRVFYKLIRPLLGWLKIEIINDFNLEPWAAESELYLFSNQLFNTFKPNRSSIIPFLSKFIPLLKTKLYRKLNKQNLKEIPYGLINTEDIPTYLQEEFYYSVPNILFEEKYIGKTFTFSQKYIISIILTSDKEELNIQKLSQKCNINNLTLVKLLEQIKTTWRRIYETT